jgi:DNA-binding Lrp family transcriptional regulator
MKMKKKNFIEILKILEKDATTKPGEIAELLGISKNEVQQAIKKAEKEGIIRRYSALINWEKAGVEEVYALVDIRVSLNRNLGYDAIAERISRFPEVQSVRLVSGEYDLSVFVRGKTMKDVANFIAEKIATLDQVRNTVTHFLLRMYKEEGDILYEKEKDRRLPVVA